MGHKVRITGDYLEDPPGPPEHAFGVRVEIDGKRIQGLQHVHVAMGHEQFAVVTLSFSADVEIDLDLETMTITDPAEEKQIAEEAALAVLGIARTAARKNYLQVRAEASRHGV